MSSRPAPVRLPTEAEQLLEGWPASERDADFWEQLAQSVEARLSLTPIGSTPDTMLAAPLPATDEDAPPVAPPRAESTPVSSIGSFTELARARVAEREQEAKRIAEAGLAVAAQVRRRTPTPVAESPAPSLQPTPAPAPSTPEASRPGPSQPLGLHWVGGAVALLAAAALILLLVMRPSPTPDAPVAVQPAAAKAPAPEAPANVPPAPVAAPPRVEQPSAGISPEQLPTAEPLAMRSSPSTAKKARSVTAAPAPAPEPAPAAPATDDLPPNPKLKLADDEERPSRPSTGAVISAVGTVMGGARACVAGHEAPSRAALVFGGSDGRVQSVEVTGPAAGTPAEACIKAALSGARVQPFAEDTFSIAVPVRP